MVDYVDFARVRALPEFALVDTVYFVQPNAGDPVRQFITGDDAVPVEIAAATAAQQLFDAGLIDAPTVTAMSAYLTGPSGTLEVGTVTTGAPGSAATVTNVGTSGAAVFDITLPRGSAGPAATITVGNVTTGAPGSAATVTNVGTSGAARFDFSIPQGEGIDLVDRRSDLAIRQQNAKMCLSRPPFATQADDYADLVPTSALTVAWCWLSPRVLLVRCGTNFNASGDCVAMTQYVLLDPAGYANVAGGLELVAYQGIVNGALHDFFSTSFRQEDIPNPDWALRIGPFDSEYSSGGEGPNYAFAGFGHSRAINEPNNNQVFSGGVGPNYGPVATRVVGKRYFSNRLSATCIYYLTFFTGTSLPANPLTTTSGSGVLRITHPSHGLTSGRLVQLVGLNDSSGLNGLTYAQVQAGGTITVIDANTYSILTSGAATSSGSGGGSNLTANPDRVKVVVDQIFDGTGLTNLLTVNATVPNVGWQDFYGDMLPVNGNSATHYKPDNLPPVRITNSLTLKGAWLASTTTSTIFQAYNEAYPEAVMTHELLYGQPVRRTTGAPLPARGLNKYGYAFFNDLLSYPKLYVFGGSSEEGPPRTAWPMLPNEVYSFQNRKVVKYLPGGPV